MDDFTKFNNYLQLMQRVDRKFADIQSKHPTSFSCRSGCFGCCKAGLTVTHVEAERIKVWLKRNADALQLAKESIASRHHGKDYCGYLDQFGGCSIYEARPTICRSHGAPTLIASEGAEGELVGDVCPLNFTDVDLGAIDSGDWIRLDTLNYILAAIDKEFDPLKAGQRVSLEGLIKGI